MNITRLNWISLLLVGAQAVLAAWWYPELPDPMPSHWNLAGEVDDWIPKPWGVWLLPLVAFALWVVFALLPLISPRGFRLDSARRAYDILWFVVIVFMAAIQWVMYMEALGRGSLGMEQVVPLMTGGLFIVIGNYLNKFPRNFFVGIRTPWTLASPEVWYRTHRLASWIFMLCGVMIAVSALMPRATVWLIAGVVVAALVPVVYSLVLYRRLHGFDDGREE